MQKFLKAAAVATAMALVATAAFAADAKASIKMTGSLEGTNGFVINNEQQKDADLLEFSVANDRAGAQFRLWSTFKNADANAVDSITGWENYEGVVRFRNASLWFKPVSMLKITVGNLPGGDLFKEKLNWWHIPNAQAAANEDYNGWTSALTDKKGGIQLDVTPVDGLAIALAYGPGYGVADLVDFEATAETDWGVSVKYNIAGFGAVGAAFKDEGLDQEKIFRVGADTNMVSGLYAMFQVIGRLEASEFAGVAFDTFLDYSMDAFNVKAHLPFTLRLLDGNYNYFTYDIKASYRLDMLTPFLKVRQYHINISDYQATNKPTEIQIGAEWGYDGGSFDLALKVDVPAASGADITWSLPFTARVSF